MTAETQPPHRHARRSRGVRATPRFATFAVAALGSLSSVACQPTPRVDLDASRRAGDAVGQGTPIALVVVGPDGGPLDEPAPTESSLTLADAIGRAVTTDPALQAALARVRVAMADADQARLLPNPVLNFVLRWGPGTPQYEISLAQDFVQAIAIPRRSSAADNRAREAASAAIETALDVANEVRERYVAVQASERLIPLLRARIELLERLVSVAQARLDAGEGTRGDLTTLQAQRVDLLVDLDRAVLAEREDRLRLALLVGQPSSAADWSLDPWVAPSADLAPESAWILAALAHRPEIESVRWKLSALGDDAALARITPWDGANVGVDAQNDSEWFVGPSVSSPIPVFDTGQAKLARATAEQLEARHELTLARRTVVEEVRIAHRTLTASVANLERIRRELVPLQEERSALAEAAFRAGQSDVTALFLAEQDLMLTQAKAIEVERQAATALARLERAVGGAGIASAVSVSAAASAADPAPSPSP
ncbi:MAG: TolC family protein [Phycisphaerales bacterium]